MENENRILIDCHEYWGSIKHVGKVKAVGIFDLAMGPTYLADFFPKISATGYEKTDKRLLADLQFMLKGEKDIKHYTMANRFWNTTGNKHLRIIVASKNPWPNVERVEKLAALGRDSHPKIDIPHVIYHGRNHQNNNIIEKLLPPMINRYASDSNLSFEDAQSLARDYKEFKDEISKTEFGHILCTEDPRFIFLCTQKNFLINMR